MKSTAPPLRGINETNLPTEQPTPQAHARLSGAHEQSRRSSGVEAPPRQGAEATDRLDSAEAAGLSSARPRARLPKTSRIRKRTEFLALQRVGRRKAGVRFVVITAAPPAGRSRLGITVSRRVGGAVVRNRVKRLVREFFRRRQYSIAPPQDIVVIARPTAAKPTYKEVMRELSGALKVHVEE